MTGITRDAMLARIRSNIEKHRYHLYLIAGKQAPRFAYTIGVSPIKGAELVFAGGATYTSGEIKVIMDAFLSVSIPHLAAGLSIKVDSLESSTFSLRDVNRTWADLVIRGAQDYYRQEEIPTLQVVPDQEHWTIDIPDMSRPWSVETEPVWQWLKVPWSLPVSDRSVAVTNLDALRGERVTEAMRWELDQWELFAGSGPDIAQDEIREVPLGTLLAVDTSLSDVVALEVGKGLWRSATEVLWHDWSAPPPESAQP